MAADAILPGIDPQPVAVLLTVCVYGGTDSQKKIYTPVHTNTCTYTHRYIYIYIYTYILHIHIYIYIYTYVCVCAYLTVHMPSSLAVTRAGWGAWRKLPTSTKPFLSSSAVMESMLA